jgi:pimeloyl-ACP methyl ester carboxylesterase
MNIILLHGLEASKERSLTTMYAFARSGFDVVAIDLFMHGDRPDSSNLEDRINNDFINLMREIIYESAKDVIAISNELGIDFEQTGLFGISAGGFSGHVLATQTPKPKAYVAAITSPDWLLINPELTKQAPAPIKMLLQSISPSGKVNNYSPVALLQLVGAIDERVHPVGAINLNNALKPLYASKNMSERLKLSIYDNVAHYIPDEMVLEAIEWFRRFL